MIKERRRTPIDNGLWMKEMSFAEKQKARVLGAKRDA